MTQKPGEVKTEKQRTIQQNRALHLYFTLVANALNEAGLDMRVVLKPGIAIPWSAETVKEHLWRVIQKAQLQKESTTELSTADIDKVWLTLNTHLAEKFGIDQPFPSVEEIMNQPLSLK